jgi:hypothetical protein
MFRRAIALWLLVFFAGCGSTPAPVEDVDKAAALFFQRFNDAEYSKIYEDGSTILKKADREEVLDTLKQLATNGRIGQYIRLSMSLPTQDDRRQAHPLYSVTTDQVRANFKLIFADEGGVWKLESFEYTRRQVMGQPQ